MTLIFPTRQGAVVLTALAFLISPAAMAQSVPATDLLDRRYEEVPGVRMPGILFTGTVGKMF
jgi:hypothetical protein